MKGIKDSGERRQFDTGAVRDIQEGKGRCDLLPLDVVGEIYRHNKVISTIFHGLNSFKHSGDVIDLHSSLIGYIHMKEICFSTMLLDVAKHFEEGAKKYGEYNWQKGIPVHCYIDSAIRHLLKWLRGDEDEPHDQAFVWNIMCAIWTCKNKPELNDFTRKELKERERG